MPNYILHDGKTVINACVADNIDIVKQLTDLNVMQSDGEPWIGWTLEEEGWRPPPPYPSWVWNSENSKWVAPVSYPTDGLTYLWDEDNLSWEKLPGSDEDSLSET